MTPDEKEAERIERRLSRSLRRDKFFKKYCPNLWRKYLDLSRTISQKWYYFLCRILPSRQYNVVRIKTLPPTWNDRDEVLLHAAFTVFCEFVEKEKPFEHFTFNEDESIKDAEFRGDDELAERLKKIDLEKRTDEAEMKALYMWWKEERPKTVGNIPQHEQDKQDDAALMRLVWIRTRMWT